jgi:hypothetical protein
MYYGKVMVERTDNPAIEHRSNPHPWVGHLHTRLPLATTTKPS